MRAWAISPRYTAASFNELNITLFPVNCAKLAAPLVAAAGEPTIGRMRMSMASEFKEFVSRGNVVDLAVGVVIGAAFGKIVSSLVDNVVMPPIGYAIGGIDFSELVIKIGNPIADAKGAITGGAVIKYGAFLNTIFQFIIIAAAIFLVVKLVNRLMPKKVAAPAGPSAEVLLLTEIRDSLKK
jgi:large conductance mechanosensitive channel